MTTACGGSTGRRPKRFTGAFSDDGRTIEGRWEIRTDGTTLETDVDLTYTQVTEVLRESPGVG